MVNKDGRVALLGDWLLRDDPQDVGVRQGWTSGEVDGAWRSTPVLSPWDSYEWDSHEGVAWYHYSFERPARSVGRWGLVLLGLDDDARVWLNGHLLSALPDAPRCVFDVSSGMQAGVNTLRIRVAHRRGPGGVLRSAHLGDLEELDALTRSEHSRVASRASADWVRDAVIYEVYLRSFSAEGTFAGLRWRLDELQELGATVLWLMPIHPVGRKNRKGRLGSPYAVRDYYGVNPEFGTLDDFRSLLDAVHARGMRLILDAVLNHTAWDCQWIDSHPQWYARDEHGEIRPPNDDWTDVAALDYANADLRLCMEEVLCYWARDVGIDGFRCDVAGYVPLDFWESVRAKLDAIKPVLLLAEADDPAQHVRAFDLSYDWRTYGVFGGLRSGTLTCRDVQRVIEEESREFPAGSLQMRFSGNHDKCAWMMPAIHRYGPQGARAAAALTFALPGVPLIYNGQEVGNPTPLPLFDRIPIDWSRADNGLRALYSNLARLRRDHEPLRRGNVRFVSMPADGRVLGIVRSLGGAQIYVVINCCDEARRVDVEAAWVSAREVLAVDARCRAGDEIIELGAFGIWIGTTGSRFV